MPDTGHKIDTGKNIRSDNLHHDRNPFTFLHPINRSRGKNVARIMDLTDISLKLYRYFIGLCNIFQPSPVYEVKEIRSEGGSAIMRHMRFRYKVILTTLAVFLILSLTACSASSKSASSYSAAENFAVAGGPVSQEDAKTSDIQDTITGTDTNSEDTNSTGTSLQDGDKIIYSGSVDLQTLDYSGTVGQIRKNERVKSFV